MLHYAKQVHINDSEILISLTIITAIIEGEENIVIEVITLLAATNPPWIPCKLAYFVPVKGHLI